MPDRSNQPSALYHVRLWRVGLGVVRWLPRAVCRAIAVLLGELYWLTNPTRRETVIQNLLPVVGRDRAAAGAAAHRLFRNFGLKLVDLLRFESGLPLKNLLQTWTGWEHFLAAQATQRGILLLTPHLGNWEFGAPVLRDRGFTILVLTQAEPQAQLTSLRQASRAQWGIETLVVREDPFAFLEIIRRLDAGAVVALLVDRPPAPTAATVELFGQPFAASIAAAELARASGCVLLPVFIPREGDGYGAHILPEVVYDRRALGNRTARAQLTQEILRAFEPVIRQHADQWYHFVPIWPR